MTVPLRVLHVSWSAGIGGVERLMLDLLSIQGGDPSLSPEVLFSAAADGGFGAAFSATGLPVRSLSLSSGRDLSPQKFRHASEIIANVDVVHMHTFNPLVAAAAMRAGRPVVFTVHGVLGLGREMRWPERVNDRLLGYFLNRHAAAVTFNSRDTERKARQRYGLHGVRCEVIYNGVVLQPPQFPLEGVDASTTRSIAGRFVVGTISRFAAFKRIDRLIDAFALLAPRLPEARLLLVGDGVLRAELEARAKDKGLSGSCIFTGFRTNARAYQEAMTVCVFPSAGEPFGLVAVETLALGKPTVVFADGGGLVEIVEPTAADDVVSNVEELAVRLQWYALHPEVIADGTTARVEQARRFDIRTTADRFRRLYLQVAQCAA